MVHSFQLGAVADDWPASAPIYVANDGATPEIERHRRVARYAWTAGYVRTYGRADRMWPVVTSYEY